jgi:hypothetical protein
VQREPTKRFQIEIRKIISSCPGTVPQNIKWKYTNMNPKSPTIRWLIKIHKPDAPIRLIISWQQAPAYKLAKLLSEKLKEELQLPFTFNIKISLQIMSEIRNIKPYNHNLRLASFDITNMYTNTATSKLPLIIKEICKNLNTPKPNVQDMLNITKTILRQNYFNFQNCTHTHTQPDGLAMGAPTSAIFSEIYLQYIEHKFIADILTNNNICGYFRYVDDILIVYDMELTNINKGLTQFNDIAHNLKFTIEEETNKVINFLDISITRQQQTFEFNIYRKSNFHKSYHSKRFTPSTRT